MTAAEFQQRLAQAYDRTRLLDTLRQMLPQTLVFERPQPVVVEDVRVKSVWQLGKVPLTAGRNLAVLEVGVDDRVDLPRNRVGLRQVVARYIDQAEYHGVLAGFRQRDAKDYRFSFAAREAALDDAGRLVRTETAPRRYTYLLGPNESCRTAAERFDLLARRGERATLQDVAEAFNVEKLNREFFGDFRKTFEVVVKDILERNRGWQQPVAERETQTLLSRLLFLYFIQRKGWLNRQRNYLLSAFNRYHDEDANGTSFNDKFLKPFFVKLSTEDAFFPNLELGDLPFLNGGLFDDEIGSLTERGRMRVGNPTYRFVFDHLLESYNFTVREDTPLDQEVAIDPEMLGKIFESLVLQLEQSDTGGKTSRHDTGSYYTPRPIVHYLGREGLRAWLEQFPLGKSADWPGRLEKLFALDASDGVDDAQRATLNELLTPEEARALLNRLDDFRACDPAVGSGAFLVGLLHELVNLHRLCETRARGKDPAADIEWLYETKKRVIENVLYGVDIQQRAVEICKLRLWISLMVDYPLEVDPDNCALSDFRRALKKITPLPNLDFKIRRADSLIEQIRGHAIKFPQTASDSRDFALSLNRLATAKHRFYEARLKKEKRLAQLDALDATAELAKYEFNAAKLKFGLLPSDKDAERLAELAAAEAEMGKLQMQISVARKKNERDKDEEIERLSRVFNDEGKPTFVWQLDFAEIFHRRSRGNEAQNSLLPDEKRKEKSEPPQVGCYGFDLVLANPPYVRQETLSEFKPYLESNYKAYNGTADLYTYFMEIGVEMLATGGVLSVIVSSSFLRAGYGEGLRRFLKKSSAVLRIVDFGGLAVFENAKDTYVCLPLIKKGSVAKRVEVCQIPSLAIQNLSAYVAENRFTIPHERLTDEVWSLKSDDEAALFEKIMRAGQSLGVYVDRKLFYGIKTGLNEAFEVSETERAEIIANTTASKSLIKPFLGGQDIRRFFVEDNKRFLIVIPCGWTRERMASDGATKRAPSEREAFDWLSDELPAVAKHLQPFAPALKKRQDQGDYWWELRPCDYYKHLDAPKIIFPDICKAPRFTLDRSGIYLANTAYCLGSASLYLLGILNSPLFWFSIANISIPFGVRAGKFRYRLIYQYMEKVPIRVINFANPAERDEHNAIEKLVEQCLAARGKNCDAWEGEINQRVCRLYGLTPDEIKIVEGQQEANAQPVIGERTLPKGQRITLGGIKYAIQLVQALLTESPDGLAWPRLADAFTLATQPTLMAQEAPDADAAAVKAWAKRWNENLPPGALIMVIEQLGAVNLDVKKSGNTWHIGLKTESQKSTAEDVNYDAWLALRVLGPAPEVQLATPVFAVPNFVDWTRTIEALAA